MRSNAGIANRQGDVDLRFAKVSAPVNTLAWLGSAWLGSARFCSAWLGSARLGLARLGSARLGLAWLLVILPTYPANEDGTVFRNVGI